MTKESGKKMSEEHLRDVAGRFLRRQWKMAIVIAVVFIGAAVAALSVLLWFVATAVATGLVPPMLGLWSIGSVITFILHLIFWELVLVGSWVAVVVLLLIFQWYKKLPEEDRKGWPQRGKRDQGGVFGFFVGLTWLIVVWVDGRWDLPLQSWTVSEWVYSILSAVFWDLLILAVPMGLYLIWWIRTLMKKDQ